MTFPEEIKDLLWNISGDKEDHEHNISMLEAFNRGRLSMELEYRQRELSNMVGDLLLNETPEMQRKISEGYIRGRDVI